MNKPIKPLSDLNKEKKQNTSTIPPAVGKPAAVQEPKEKQVNLLEIDNEFSDFISHAAPPLSATNSAAATQKQSSVINDCLVSFDDFG